MSEIIFAAECPRRHMLWKQTYRVDQIRAAIAGELQLEFWCEQCGDTFEADDAQLERLERPLPRFNVNGESLRRPSAIQIIVSV